jgi:hypothetical protein
MAGRAGATSSRPIRRLLLVCLALAACAAPAASLDPGAPCGGREELRSAGLERDLEILLPDELGGRPPDARSSGRYCSRAQLGSLVEAGLRELRFAGATWADTDGGRSLTVYQAPGLTLDRLADSFAGGAGSARRVTNVRAAESSVGGRRQIRIDALAGERQQAVLLWEDPRPETVRAILASGVTDSALEEAVAAFFR